MYGMVNKAIEGLVVSKHGEETWRQVKEFAEVDIEVFIGMDPYPDEITYRLVAAASAVLNVPSEQVLEDFGEYWTLYTAMEGYGHLFRAAGSNLKEFLANLNTLHTHVGLIYPQMRIPDFHLIELDERTLHLEYISTREGFAPMVIGLVKGLGKIFQQPLDIRIVTPRNPGTGKTVFELRLIEA